MMIKWDYRFFFALGFLLLISIGCNQNGDETVTPGSAIEVATQAVDTPTVTETPVPEPTETTTPTETPEPTIPPTPLPEIDLAREISEGDPLRGRNQAVRYRCHGCHVDDEAYGPPLGSTDELPHIMERGELRMADPAYSGRATTNQEYIVESILLPEAHFIEGEWEEDMPTTLLVRITEDELANIFAWMKSLE